LRCTSRPNTPRIFVCWPLAQAARLATALERTTTSWG
jgi:hypothetical protein